MRPSSSNPETKERLFDLRRLSESQRRRLAGLALLSMLAITGIAWLVARPLPELIAVTTPTRSAAITYAYTLATDVDTSGAPPAPTNTLVLRTTPDAATPPPAFNPSQTEFASLVPALSPTATLRAGRPTPTASPTATPAASGNISLPRGWPGRYPELSASKISVHVIRNEDRSIMDMVRRGFPRVIKAVDEFSWLREVKEASPGTLTVGRILGQDETWVGTRNPVAAAREYVDSQLAAYQRSPYVDYWEGWNEYQATTPDKMQWYGQFEAARACLMQGAGYRAAVGGFSMGTPEYDQMLYFLPALQAAYRCGGIFTLHEGVMPVLGCGVSVNNPYVYIPDSPRFRNVPVGYLTARYRFWYEGYLKPMGIGDLPLVISELTVAGIVSGSPCNGPGGTEWKTFADWWVQQGIAPTGPEAYLKFLAWYDTLIRSDPYVAGVAVFTAGALSSELGWTQADLHDVLPLLTNYLISQH